MDSQEIIATELCLCLHLILENPCSEVKERMKKQRGEKAALKAADNKKAGGKAQKNVQSFTKGAAKNFKR